MLQNYSPLLAFIALSAAQSSSAQTLIHSAILVIDTSNNWLVRTPYLSIKASNVLQGD